MAENENPVTFDETAGSIDVQFNPLVGLESVNLNGDVFSPQAIAEIAETLGVVIDGMIEDSEIREDGVRLIKRMRIHSLSLVSPEQTLHPSWQITTKWLNEEVKHAGSGMNKMLYNLFVRTNEHEG